MSHSILDEFETDNLELAQQLLNMRQRPSVELQQRIRTIPQKLPRQPRPGPRLVWGSLMLIIALLLLTSPVAQATLGQFQKVIGQVHLTILDVLPHRTGPIIVESTPVTLLDARTAVPFEILTPTYLPSGLTARPELYVIELRSPIVKMLWRDVEGGFLQLSIHEANDEHTSIRNVVGSQSSDTILINGQEAAIIYGGWDKTSRTWSYQDRLMTLIWVVDGVQYNLLSYSSMIPPTELITMAQSIR